MAKIVIIHNNKGGIGKTTVTKAIAEYLAEAGFRTLIIDADGQGSMTKKLVENYSKCYSKEWFKFYKNTKIVIKEILLKTIIKTNIKNLDVVPCDREMFEFIKVLDKEIAAETLLKQNLDELNNFNIYDYIFIDLSPSWDVLSNSGYLAADSIIQLVDRTEDALQASIKNILDWDNIAYRYKVKNKINAIILNRVNSSAVSKSIIKNAHNVGDFDGILPFEYKTKVLNSYIPEAAGIEKSVVNGGKKVVDLKNLDKWKPTQKMQEFLKSENINVKEGNPFVNIIMELNERGVL